MFDVEGISAASQRCAGRGAGAALQYGATEGYQPCASSSPPSWRPRARGDVAPEQLIVTTGSQQALDLLGKTLINPGDKVIVEGPTFRHHPVLSPVWRRTDQRAHRRRWREDRRAGAPDCRAPPQIVYLIPTFGNPSGAMLSLERRKKVLELAVKYQTLVVEDDPWRPVLWCGRRPQPAGLVGPGAGQP